MSKSPYGKIAPLKTTLKQVECWNFTDNSKHDLPAGTLVRVDNVNDCTHTTICVIHENGVAKGVSLVNGNGQTVTGYRFIVENKVLAEATGLTIQDKTDDIVGDIIAYEAGELDDNDTRNLFQKLRNNGMIEHLQGSYGRMASALGI